MKQIRVLLVEDDDPFAAMVQIVLGKAGFPVIRASNGQEALRIYNPETIDLVLTDLVMPDMEGIELIIQLRRLYPGIKIIAMSGGMNSKKIYLPSARLLGADCTLEKPFASEQLLAVIRGII